MNNDLYIYFLSGMLIISGLALAYFSYRKFEIAVFLFALSPLISAIFFDNLPQETLIVTEATIGIGGTLRALLLGVLGIVGIAKFLTTFPRHQFKIPTQLLILGIFILFSFLSFIYTLDQQFTIIRAGLLFAVFGFLLGFYAWLGEKGNLDKALNSLYLLVSIVIFATLLGIVVIPNRVWWWKLPRLVGLWEHPNTYGSFSMLAYPIIIWKFYTAKNKKYLVLLPLLTNLILHILTGSRTTLLSAFAGVIVWLILEKDWIKLISISILLGIFSIALLNFSPESFKRMETSDITDLSSREDIWDNAFIFIKEKPLIGYGFGVEGKIFQDELKVDLEGSFIERTVRQSLHNGYLSMLVGGGLFGLILWLIIIGFPLIKSFSLPFSPEKAYAIFTIVTVIITNFVESALTGYSLPSDIFFWLAWLILGTLFIKHN